MGYSTSSTFDYTSLEKKHGGFFAPEFKIEVGGTALDPAKFHITSCDVTMPITVGNTTAQPEAGECTFVLSGMFDLQTHKFVENMENVIAVGKKIVVRGGYRNPPILFKGCIKSVYVKYKQGGVTCEVTALDALEAMRGAKQIKTFNKEAPSKTVREILNNAVSSTGSSVGKIDSLPALDVSLVQDGRDDAEIIHMLARRFGKTLGIIQGEIVFTDMLKNKTPIGTLTFGKNLFDFKKKLDSTGIIGAVTVNGQDIDGKAIQGKCTSITCGGSGKSAKQWDSDVSNKTYEEEDAIATKAADLKQLAENILNESNMTFVTGSASCIGIPELIPGRYIKLDGMSDKSNGTYFISSVTHSFGDGYTCQIELKGAKSN